MKRTARESLPLKTIFDDECNKVHVDVASQLCFGRLESTLQQVRKENVPPLPCNAGEFDIKLTSEEWHGRFACSISGRRFYRENIVVGENNNLLFLSENLEELLSTCEEIHVDGTFKVVPSVPRLKQLFVVMAIAHDQAFAVCYVLMERRTYEIYKRVFERLKQLIPAMNPQTVMSDYESGIMKAVYEVFPDSIITGCWWHYANRILKKCKSLRLLGEMRRAESVRLIIHMFMALPLLPAEKMQQGVDAIQVLIGRETFSPATTTALIELVAYTERQWIQKVGVDRVSVHGSTRRTNNDSESFNMTLRREIRQAHPNAWAFVGADLDQPASCDPYRLYRVVATEVVPTDFMVIERIQEQQRELLLSIDTGVEPSFPAEDGDVVCTMCLTNKPTRYCVPCGHAVTCRQCLEGFVRQEIVHTVTLHDGSIADTPLRLPITCPTCRAIVGQLIQLFA